MKLQPLEADIQKAIIDAFRMKHRIILWPIDAGGARMRRGRSSGQGGTTGIPEGFPDLLGIVPPHGEALFIECKRPGCRPTKKQTEFLEFLRSKGCIAFWADSVESALDQFVSYGGAA